MLKLAGFVIAASLATSTAALAQTGMVGGYSPQGTLRQNLILHDSVNQRNMSAAYADSIRERAANRRSDERMDRARRLTTLANEGQCRQAVNIARREGDIYMMRSLIHHCRLPDRTLE